MNRFVILQHSPPTVKPAQPLHWDLMLEVDDKLVTWALAEFPWTAGEFVVARQLPPHRLAYLSFEGELSKNRGTVQRCEQGTYQTAHCDRDLWEIRLEGTQVHGIVRLSRQAGAEHWNLLFCPRG